MKSSLHFRKLALALGLSLAAAPLAFPQRQADAVETARPALSLIVPDAPVGAGGALTVSLVALNATGHALNFDAPDTLDATLTSGNSPSVPLTLRINPRDDRGIDTLASRQFAAYAYETVLPAGITGRRILDIQAPAPMRAILDIAETAAPQTSVSASPAAAPLDTPPPPALAKVQRSFLGNFATYEPIYFIYGPDGPAAKFQFSFMYRILADEGYLAQTFPFLKGLSFAYTQRSLWDIDAESSPFYDTSYIPEIFCAYMTPAEKITGGGFNWLGFQAGFAHESNGRDGSGSRSMNKVTARALFSLGNLDGWRVIFGPRVWGYVGDMSDNANLNDYRGYMDLTASLGKNDSIDISVYLRPGQSFKKGVVQIDLTYPLDVVFKNFAGYFLVQYWNGYGESLINYDKRSETIRFGVSLVR